MRCRVQGHTSSPPFDPSAFSGVASLQESQSTGQCAANVPRPFHSSPFSHRICIAPPPRAIASLAAKRPVLCRWYVPRHPELCRLLQGHSPSLPFAPLLSEVLHSSTPLRPCDKDEGGCGEPIPTTHVLDKAPRLFTVGTSFLDHDMKCSRVDNVSYVFLVEKDAQEECFYSPLRGSNRCSSLLLCKERKERLHFV
jgi:hypothetical protein